MWPFSRRKSTADDAISVMEPASKLACEKWLYYCKTLPFQDGVPLGDRITSFAMPAMSGMREHIRELQDAPDALLLMIVLSGVKRSGTHSVDDIVAAMTPPGQSPAQVKAALELFQAS